MAFYPSDVIRVAKAEIGYHEKASALNLDSKTANSGANNYTKYARDLDKIKYFNTLKQGFDWCAVTFNWDIYQAIGKDADKARAVQYQGEAKYNTGAGCTPQAATYRANNAFFASPKAGDQIFFGTTGDEVHTGLVVEVSGREVYTIEGNVQNQVMLLKYPINSPKIVGYGRPKYDANDPYVVYVVKAGDTLDKIASEYDTTAKEIAKANDISDPNKINTSMVLIFKKGTKEFTTNDVFCKLGDRNNAVKMLQALLLRRGLSLTYDGYFGAETRSAVMAWQNSQNITVDGIVGYETLKTL